MDQVHLNNGKYVGTTFIHWENASSNMEKIASDV